MTGRSCVLTRLSTSESFWTKGNNYSKFRSGMGENSVNGTLPSKPREGSLRDGLPRGNHKSQWVTDDCLHFGSDYALPMMDRQAW